MQGKQYTALLDRLRQTEELVYGNTDSLDVDVEDVRPHSSTQLHIHCLAIAQC